MQTFLQFVKHIQFRPSSPSVMIDTLRWVAVGQAEGHASPFLHGRTEGPGGVRTRDLTLTGRALLPLSYRAAFPATGPTATMFCAEVSYAILPYVRVLGVVECLCAHTVHTHIGTAHAHTHGQMTASLVRIRPRSQEDIPRPPPPAPPPQAKNI